MQDLTQGSVVRHLIGMGAFIGAGLVFQTMYFLIDLYFVAQIGEEAAAGVSAAGITFFLVFAMTQMVSVGSMALIAHAVGAKDSKRADLIFNQGVALSLGLAAITCVLGYSFGDEAVGGLTADAATAQQGREYLFAFLPALALMYPTITLGSALRGAGVVAPTMVIQTSSLALNALLAPVLIAGWGTGVPLGVAGAGWASTIAGVYGFIASLIVFPRVQKLLRVHIRSLKPRFEMWGRILAIGLPTAGEMFLMFCIFGVVYWVTRQFGADAQAGFGIAGRIMQAFFLPAMAVSFAAGPIIGQNFGAKRFDRVRETFSKAALIGSGMMFTMSILCMWKPEMFMHIFTSEDDVVDVGSTYLHILSWNFVASGLAFTCSALFQGLGNTMPSLFASASRLLTYAAPAIWWSMQPGAKIEHFWYMSVAATTVQAAIALAFAWRELRRKLGRAPISAEAA